MVWLHTSTEFLWDICIVRISIRSACPICAKGTKQCKCLLGVAVVSFGYNPTPHPCLHIFVQIKICELNNTVFMILVDSCDRNRKMSPLSQIRIQLKHLNLNHPPFETREHLLFTICNAQL